MKTFSIREAFNRGWGIFKNHKGLLALATLISFITGGWGKGGSYASHHRGWHGMREHFQTPGIFSVLLFVVGILIQIGLVKMLLKLEDGEKTELKEIVQHGDLFIKYLAVYVLFMLGLIVGFVLLVIPGIWFMLTYTFAPILVVDKQVSIRHAFDRSAEMTKGHKWKLLGLFLAMIGANILGAICLVVGLLVSVPVSALAYMHVYRKLAEGR